MKRELEDELFESKNIAKMPKMEILEEDESVSSPTSSTSPPEDSTPLVLPKFMEVKCGNLVGVLHTERFICPGIREKCIEVPDLPGVLLTPVEFTIKADKSRQKDWKGAIKHNGRMLRTLMEIKQLDFYNHQEQCSFKCHSRNYITKNGTNPQPQKRRNSAGNSSLKSNSMDIKDILKNPNFLAAFAVQYNAENTKRLEEAERQRQRKQKSIRTMIEKEPATFWQQTLESNLPSLVINRIGTELGALTQNVAMNNGKFAESAGKLSQIIQILGISDSLAQEMCGKFVLPMGVLDAKIEAPPSPPEPSQMPLSNLLINNNNDEQKIMSSSEKLEFMISQAAPM